MRFENMKFATENAKLSFGLSEMARTHKNDVIANALARLADKVASKEMFDDKKLSKVEKELLVYFHNFAK